MLLASPNDAEFSRFYVTVWLRLHDTNVTNVSMVMRWINNAVLVSALLIHINGAIYQGFGLMLSKLKNSALVIVAKLILRLSQHLAIITRYIPHAN